MKTYKQLVEGTDTLFVQLADEVYSAAEAVRDGHEPFEAAIEAVSRIAAMGLYYSATCRAIAMRTR